MSRAARCVITPDQDRAALLADALRTVAAVVLLSALFLAPLNYGSTRLMAYETLVALAFTGSAAWLLACGLAHAWTWPPLPARIGIGLIGLSAVVWLFALARPELPEFTERHLARIVARWPHSVVPRDFSWLIAGAAAGLASLTALTDLARDPLWRKAVAAVILVTGASVAVLGMVQNATGASGIYWEASHRMPGAFFGPFFHHTAAGAYLNTVWPLGFALALAGIQRGRFTPRGRLLVGGSLACAGVVLVAHAAHVSRFPQVIAAVVLLAFVTWTGFWRGLGRVPGLRWALTIAAIATGAAVVTLGAGRLDDIAARWDQIQLANLIGGRAAVAPPAVAEWPRLMRDDLFIPSDHRAYPLGDRGATYAAALSAIAERPWFGWGPGGWTAAAAAHSADPFVRTFFLTVQFTHNDLLQAGVEWGLVGAAGWLLVLGGSVVFALLRLRRSPAHDYLGAGAITALTAVFVQSVIDFPLQIPAVQFNAFALAALGWSVPDARTTSAAVSAVPSL